MAEDRLFENLVRTFISAPAKIRSNRFYVAFFDAVREPGIVTHFAEIGLRPCGAGTFELKETPASKNGSTGSFAAEGRGGSQQSHERGCRKSAAIRAGVPSP